MSATTTVHPARAAMDLWRHTTPRQRLLVVRTVRDRDLNGNTEFRGYYRMARVVVSRDFDLTANENHLAAAMSALQEYQDRPCRLVDFTVTDEKHGTFVFEAV